MPDITMCQGLGCDKADLCYRHTAVPNEFRQSYFARPPLDEYAECEYFWPNEKYEEQEQQE